MVLAMLTLAALMAASSATGSEQQSSQGNQFYDDFLCPQASALQSQIAQSIDFALSESEKEWNCRAGPATCFVVLQRELELVRKDVLRERESAQSYEEWDSICGTKLAILGKVHAALSANREQELVSVCDDQFGGHCE